MGKRLIISCLLGLIMPLSLLAQNCDCKPLSPQAAQDSADIIFVGTCVHANTNWIAGGMKYSFEVQRGWKKSTDRFFMVSTPFVKNCGVPFEIGEQYLIYVRKKFTPKTDLCLGTKPLAEAKADLTLLGPATPPQRSSMIQPMYWTIGILGFLALAIVAFIVLRKQFGNS